MTEIPPGSSPVDQLVPGSRIREWKVERFLARGAFGQVFEATRDTWRDEPTRALKVFDPILSSAARSGLVTEFELLRGVRHPHLLAGEDAFDIDDGPLAGCVVFVMEQADVDLATVVARDGLLTPADAASIGAQLSEGLAALHDGGHLHGDVKPANALRAGGLWKLGDFGVAASLQGSYARPIGATLDYRPPEVAQPEAAGRVHRSADVWALGTTLWVAASGHHPFVGTDATVRHAAVLRGERQPAPDLDLALADLIDRRCLAPDPHTRATAADLAVELRQLADLYGAPPPGPQTDDPAGSVWNHPATGADDQPATTVRAVAATTRSAAPPLPPDPMDPDDRPVAAGPVPAAGGEVEADDGETPATATMAEPGQVRGGLLGVLAGAIVGGAAAEAASLAASLGPGGLAVRRTVYVLLTVVVLVAVGGALARRVRRHLGPTGLPAAVVGALVVVALITAYLFSST
ncbi:hypothetical protein BH24ACT4_BH24ACT4_09920 [soil metagenome]